ncbi:MAG: CRISPR-associated protein Csx19 [Saprospiraceae bacterium]
MKSQYKLCKCTSDVVIFEKTADFNAQIIAFQNAKAVVWYFDAIRFVNIESGTWSEKLRDFSELVRLRLFDKDKELHIWRSNDDLKGRLRTDYKGESTDAFCANQIMNGTQFKLKKPGIVATEDKGVFFEMPYTELENAISDKQRIVLKTINYIGYANGIGQAGIVDCRFVDFSLILKSNS